MDKLLILSNQAHEYRNLFEKANLTDVSLFSTSEASEALSEGLNTRK